MKILFVGDIVGKSGRDVVSSLLYGLKDRYGIDIVIANAENSAHGKGITFRIYNQLISLGIDYITMGNHTYSKSEINEHMTQLDRLIVPYNHLLRHTDNYARIIEYKDLKFCLCNILGSAFMNENSCDPFEAFNRITAEYDQYDPDFYFVDLHAEATSEKRLFAAYFSDKAKVVLGTHTHVQTADEDIINGCAFISDVGMCGPYDSIIGRDIDETIQAIINKMPTKYTISETEGIFCGVIIEIDDQKKCPVGIERIQMRPEKN